MCLFSKQKSNDFFLDSVWQFMRKFIDSNESVTYSALLIYRGLFSPSNSWKTPIDRPLGRGMVVFTGGNRTKLPSPRWRRRGRSLREVFACSCFFATTDLAQICNRETRRYGTSCTKTTDSYLFSFLYNDPRKIRRETTVGKFVLNNGRR